MLHRPILSGRIGKWSYALIEYDLVYEPLKSMKVQIIANFIVKHWIDDEHDLEVGYISFKPWKLYFDGSACRDGQGIGVVFISPSGSVFEVSCCLEYFFINNQAEYEALLFGLLILEYMDVIETFGDSLFVMQQVSKVF